MKIKKILKELKNIIVAPFLIYIYNLVAYPLGLVVPINIITVLVVGILGIPGLVTLIIYLLVSF